MGPIREKNTVEVPLTLDVGVTAKYLNKFKVYIGYIIMCGIIIAAVVLMLLFRTWGTVILCLIGSILAIIGMRYIYFEEGKYKKQYKDLLEHQNNYGSDLYWGIYEVSNGKVPICYFKNGQKAVFVGFEKDIQIGATQANAEEHWDAITAAYRQLAYKNITCVHLDFMDNIGKDKRLDNLINTLMETSNSDLRKLLAYTFDYQRQLMQETYLMYDVYAFYFTGDDSTFKTDIEDILNMFLNANYAYYYYMRLEDLRELVKPLYGIENFSAVRASESVFANDSVRKRIRVINYVKDGEFVKVADTQEEIQQKAREELERKQQKKRDKHKPKKSVQTEKGTKADADSTVETQVRETVTVTDNVTANIQKGNETVLQTDNDINETTDDVEIVEW